MLWEGVAVFASNVAIWALIIAVEGVTATGMGGKKISPVIGRAGGGGTAAV